MTQSTMIQAFPTSTSKYPTYMQPQGYYYAMPQFPPQPQQQIMPVAEHITPTTNDVLMGRGGNNNKWEGNERLRDMARARINQYQKADKKEKSNMSLLLVSQVKALSPAGRFLKRDPNTLSWHVVPDELAREKASQCLRDAVSCYKKQRNSPEPQKKENNPKPEQTTSGPAPKRKITSSSGHSGIDAIVSHKRRRTETSKVDDAAISGSFSLPADVVSYLLDDTPVNKFSKESDLFAELEASLDLEPLDFQTSMADEQTLMWEPIPLSAFSF